MSTPIDRLVDWYSTRYDVPAEESEDIINEFISVGTAYLCGERDDYDDLSEIIMDYLGIEVSEYNEITKGW